MTFRLGYLIVMGAELSFIFLIFLSSTSIDEKAIREKSKPQTIEQKIELLKKNVPGDRFQNADIHIVVSKPLPLEGISTKQLFLLNPKTNELTTVFTDKEYPLGSKVKIQWIYRAINYPNTNAISYQIIKE